MTKNLRKDHSRCPAAEVAPLRRAGRRGNARGIANLFAASEAFEGVEGVRHDVASALQQTGCTPQLLKKDQGRKQIEADVCFRDHLAAGN